MKLKKEKYMRKLNELVKHTGVIIFSSENYQSSNFICSTQFVSYMLCTILNNLFLLNYISISIKIVEYNICIIHQMY